MINRLVKMLLPLFLFACSGEKPEATPPTPEGCYETNTAGAYYCASKLETHLCQPIPVNDLYLCETCDAHWHACVSDNFVADSVCAEELQTCKNVIQSKTFEK